MKIISLLESYTFLHNTAWDYVLALGVFLLSLLILKFIQVVIIVRLKKLASKTKTDLDDTAITIFQNIRPPFYVLVSFYFGFKMLYLSELGQQILHVLFLLVVVYEIVRAVEKIIDYWAYRQTQKQGEDESEQNKSVMRILKVMIKMVLWIVALLMVLSNLGVNITSLVASLGIGGIAVALALQNVLSDLFSSFSIFIDKPFRIGDYIAVGEHSGVVERIGMKTTRLRTLLGEELVISNKELTSARVQNFKRMERRRELFILGVTYETSKEKLEKIPELVKKAVEEVEHTEFARCHFATYGDFSLNFEVVYYVDEPDYAVYMNARQAVNLRIFELFQKEGIGFAYPTQMIYTKKA